MNAQVTSEVLWEEPSGVTFVDMDDFGTQLRAEPARSRVMPSQAQLVAGAVRSSRCHFFRCTRASCLHLVSDLSGRTCV